MVNRKQGVDVKYVSPPVIGAIFVIHGGRIEDRVVVEPLHGDHGDTQDVHVGRGEPAEPVGEEAEELEKTLEEALSALGQPVKISFGVGAEVEEADQ